MAYTAKIKVTLRQSILDVQGKAVEHALKYIEVTINEEERLQAERICNEISQKLLSNPVMENYSFELEQVN
jgi:phosphoribosylformylglycinamidine (FGAM) synthase PurS component